MGRHTFLQRCVALVMLAAFTSCATLRVDVDVYKGPLANREEVQLEQMAVMAVGARPLLLQLRDRLEYQARGSYAFKTESNGWYRNDYVPEPGPVQFGDTSNFFMSSQASRVNAILGLYLDQEGAKTVEGLLDRGGSGVEAYLEAWKILNPKSTNSGKAKYEKFENAYKTKKRNILELAGGLDPTSFRSQQQKIDQIRTNLLKAYQKIIQAEEVPLRNTDRKIVLQDWDCVFSTHKELWETLSSSAEIREKLLGRLDPINLPISTTGEDDGERGATNGSASIFEKCAVVIGDADDERLERDTSNFAYRVLAESKIVERHAALLFQDARTRSEFVAEVKGIAQSYLDLRQASEDLLLASLEALVYTDSLHYESAIQRAHIIGRLAEYTANLIEPLHLRLALDMTRSEPDVKRFRDALKAELTNEIFDSYARWDAEKGIAPEIHDEVMAAIKTVLIQEPIAFAIALFSAHEEFKSTSEPKWSKENYLSDGRKTQFLSSERRRYGIAVGPSTQAVTIDENQLRDNFDEVANAFKSGLLRRGRMPDGLFTLIENYMKLKDLAYPHDVVAEPEEARSVETLDREVAIHRLRDALVRFSETMLRVANSEHLLKEDEDGEIAVAGLYSRGRQPSRELSFVKGKADLEGLDRYVLVLQAIGNSILVQANELQARESHENKIERSFARERLGLQLAYSASPSQILDDIESFIKSRSATGAKSAAQLTTDIETETKKQRTLEGKDATGKEIKPPPAGSIPALAAVVDALKATQTKMTAATTAFDGAKRNRDWFPKADAIPAAPAAPTGLAKLKTDFHAFLTKGFKPPDPPKPAEPGGTPAVIVLEVPKPAADLKTAIVDQFGELILAATDNAQVKAVQSIRTAFEAAHQAANATGAIKPSVYLGKINEQLGKTLISRREALAVIPKSGDLTTAQAAVTTAQASLTTIKTTITGLNAEKTKATERENAVKQVQEHRPKVLAVADGRAAPLSGPGVVDELRKALNASKAAANAATKTALQQALDFVALFPTPLEAPIDPSLNSKSSKDVLDDVIALLREEHLKVSRAQGPNSPRALQLKATLEEAHAHRSGMVYIRQASSYLRTSYATSSLQVDPGVSWRNLLGEDAIRGIPLVGEDMYNSARGLTKDRIALVSEIDKQFWQNINSVRVSGAGNTNYVIAKDDIGNWYVKNYSADPEPIIRGAESLAMFAMGGVMETDLLSRVQAARAGEAAPAGTPSLNPLTKVLTRYQSEYAKKTNTDLGELAESLGDTSKSTEAAPKPFTNAITAAIFSQWKSSDEIYKQGDELATRLQSAGNQHLKPASVLLAKAKIEPTKAKDLIDEIQRDTDTDLTPRDADTTAIAVEMDNSPNAVMAQQLELIEMDVVNPKVNVPLLDAIAKAFEVDKNEGLKKQFADLRDALGSPHQGQDIADALQAMRRFHNLLTASIADVDFVSVPKAKLEEAEKKLKELLTAIENAEKAKSDASTALVGEEVAAEKERLEGIVAAQQAIIDAKTGEKPGAEEAVTTAKAALEAAKKAKVLARNGVTRLVKSEIDKFIEKRESSLRAHEDQLSFVGDAAGS